MTFFFFFPSFPPRKTWGIKCKTKQMCRRDFAILAGKDELQNQTEKKQKLVTFDLSRLRVFELLCQ